MSNGPPFEHASSSGAPGAEPTVVESDPLFLRAAVAVSEVTRAQDGSLEALAERRAASGLGPAELARARDLLRLVGAALVGKPSEARWRRIEAAYLAADSVQVEYQPVNLLQALAPEAASPVVVDDPAIRMDPEHQETASNRSPPVVLPSALPSPSRPGAQSSNAYHGASSSGVASPAASARPGSGRVTGEMPAFSLEALPFQGGAKGTEVRPARAPTVDIEGTVLPFRRRRGTEGVDSDQASEAGPSLTIEQFASFSAERELYPEAAAEVRARYGIDSPDEERALDASFRVEFERDPTALRKFDDARMKYRAWLLERR